MSTVRNPIKRKYTIVPTTLILDDTKRLEEYYKEQLDCQKSNLNREKCLALDCARAETRLEASNEKLELLIWLYKENPNE